MRRVRRYVPELVLADESAAEQITVLNLLNHTSGLDWGVIGDFSEGDDALARYVSALAGLSLITPPGARASYSQAGFNLAGRIVEKVTGLTFEKAVASLVFSPVGLVGSFFDRDDIMTRRFAVGHNRGEEPPPDPAPFEVGLLPRDEYIVTGGEYADQRGFFTRDASGAVAGVDLAGRLATRV